MVTIPETGEWFDGFKPEIVAPLAEVADLLYTYNIAFRPSQKPEREALIRNLFIRTGERFTINSPFHCDYGKIIIGEDFLGNFNLTILDEATVTIGNRVFIGPNVSIYTIQHHLVAEQRNIGVMRALPVTIGDNVWIGGNCVIMPGITIGDGAVIGAGSVVTRDIPAGVVAYGNPCKVIRSIEETD